MMNRKLAASFLLVLVGAALSGGSAHADGGPIDCPKPPERRDRVLVWDLEFQSATLNGAAIDATDSLPIISTPDPKTRAIDLTRTDFLTLTPMPNAAGHLTEVMLDGTGVTVVFEREE